jgi:hypothetical protein
VVQSNTRYSLAQVLIIITTSAVNILLVPLWFIRMQVYDGTGVVDLLKEREGKALRTVFRVLDALITRYRKFSINDTLNI